ncbi:MAG: hypothetical protein WAN52_08455 [Pseudolabrys sp.]
MDRKSDSHHFFIIRLLRHRNSLPFFGLIQVEAFMIGDSKTHEWNLLKEQFALLVRAEAVRADDAKVLLDVEFQRRLAEVIEQVLKRKRGSHH